VRSPIRRPVVSGGGNASQAQSAGPGHVLAAGGF
jgi:hypothetical protein